MGRWVAAGLVFALVAAWFYPIAPGTSAPQSAPQSSLDEKLTHALRSYADERDTIDALVVATSNAVLFEHGATHLPINTHSVRKSVMNVLIGAAARDGGLDVSATLQELDIDDAEMPLTERERTAKVTDLLKARSGIYIEAAGETPEMKAARPQRGQYAPGDHYYYNNWDFNTLGTVLAAATGVPLESHLTNLAERLSFEDFSPDHLRFADASGSEHDQYVIYLSARDLAKIGQMMLRDGLTADGQTFLEPEWIRTSTAMHSELTDRQPLDGYGYLWSVDADAGTYWATGWGGQFMLVDPARDLLIVTRNDTGRRLGEFVWLVLLGNSGQGRMAEVAAIHELLLSP